VAVVVEGSRIQREPIAAAIILGSITPRFGYVPELGYSNAVFFRLYPYSN